MRRPCNEVVDLLVQMGVELQTYGRMSVQLVYPTCCSVLKTGPIKSFRSDLTVVTNPTRIMDWTIVTISIMLHTQPTFICLCTSVILIGLQGLIVF